MWSEVFGKSQRKQAKSGTEERSFVPSFKLSDTLTKVNSDIYTSYHPLLSF